MFISVAIPTCNRPNDVAQCLASLARVRYPRWEVLIIDQSDGHETELLAAEWGALIPRIVYLPLNQKNLSAARNLAMEKATGEVLAFIDDDCTVAPDWLDNISDVFEEQPRAKLIFGEVEAGEHDHTAAFVTTAKLRHTGLLHGSLGATRLSGIGASMCLRLGSTQHAPFDLHLGAGSQFRAGEERDYAFRLLAAGGTVAQSPQIVVTHHGARPFAGGVAASQMRSYFYGSGACDAKLMRCGYWGMIAVIATMLAEHLALVRPLNALLRRPTHAGRLLIYLRGLRDGFRAPLDRRSWLFN